MHTLSYSPHRATALAGLAALGLAASQPAAAQGLDGTSVTGNTVYANTNLFDPANGFVPSGYGNRAGTTVTVTEAQVEFATSFLNSFITADFTDSRLTIIDGGVPGDFIRPGTDYTFTDSAFRNFTGVKLISSIGYGNSLTYRLDGDSLFIGASNGRDIPQSRQAIFEFTPVPEASTTVSLGLLLALGLGGVGIAAKRRRTAA